MRVRRRRRTEPHRQSMPAVRQRRQRPLRLAPPIRPAADRPFARQRATPPSRSRITRRTPQVRLSQRNAICAIGPRQSSRRTRCAPRARLTGRTPRCGEPLANRRIRAPGRSPPPLPRLLPRRLPRQLPTAPPRPPHSALSACPARPAHSAHSERRAPWMLSTPSTPPPRRWRHKRLPPPPTPPPATDWTAAPPPVGATRRPQPRRAARVS